jgi:hypothetical protein
MILGSGKGRKFWRRGDVLISKILVNCTAPPDWLEILNQLFVRGFTSGKLGLACFIFFTFIEGED